MGAAVADTIRISKESKQALRELADRDDVSMQDVLARAIEKYRRDRIMEAFNAGYARLRNDSTAWKAEQDERAEWNKPDGLDE